MWWSMGRRGRGAPCRGEQRQALGSGGAAADTVAGDLGVIGAVDGSASWSGLFS